MARKLGIFLCLLGFAAVLLLPLVVLDTNGPFGSLKGIEQDLSSQAQDIINPVADGVQVDAQGRVLNVTLPAEVSADYDEERLRSRILDEVDGVREVNFDVSNPVVADAGAGDTGAGDTGAGDAGAGDPQPTEAQEPEASDEPTAEPTQEPDPDPEPDPTAEPAPEPTVAPELDADDVVADLAAISVDFVPDTATLTAGDTRELVNVATLLANVEGGPIEVQSHTSTEGDPDVNLLLSQDRAQAVIDYLVDQGVDPALLVGRGFGGSQPIADNDTPEGRETNERITFALVEP